jgi:hypothetical protein
MAWREDGWRLGRTLNGGGDGSSSSSSSSSLSSYEREAATVDSH